MRRALFFWVDLWFLAVLFFGAFVLLGPWPASLDSPQKEGSLRKLGEHMFALRRVAFEARSSNRVFPKNGVDWLQHAHDYFLFGSEELSKLKEFPTDGVARNGASWGILVQSVQDAQAEWATLKEEVKAGANKTRLILKKMCPDRVDDLWRLLDPQKAEEVLGKSDIRSLSPDDADEILRNLARRLNLLAWALSEAK